MPDEMTTELAALEYVRRLGRQANRRRVLWCPECNRDGDVCQDLAAAGDEEEILFCPHCGFRVRLVVEVMPYRDRNCDPDNKATNDRAFWETVGNKAKRAIGAPIEGKDRQ